MNNAKKPQRAARALDGSARGMGVLRRASDSIAAPLAGEIKYHRASYPRCSHPALFRLRACYNRGGIMNHPQNCGLARLVVAKREASLPCWM
jgi:hypothetical protein